MARVLNSLPSVVVSHLYSSLYLRSTLFLKHISLSFLVYIYQFVFLLNVPCPKYFLLMCCPSHCFLSCPRLISTSLFISLFHSISFEHISWSYLVYTNLFLFLNVPCLKSLPCVVPWLSPCCMPSPLVQGIQNIYIHIDLDASQSLNFLHSSTKFRIASVIHLSLARPVRIPLSRVSNVRPPHF